MKNINQIFKNNTHLMDEPEIIELIEYCQELEGEEIYDSCDKTLTDDQLSERFKETPRVDFKEAVINLKKYMGAVSQMYGFML